MSDDIERIHAFDMDGTLLDTHSPETGQVEWQRLHGEPWPHKGWWGRPETLTKLPVKKFEDMVQHLDAAKADSKGHTMVITGRVDNPKMRGAVMHAFSQAGVEPPGDVHLKTGGSPTEVWKGQRLKEIASRYPNLKEIHMWDDRPEHIPYFKSLNDPAHPHHPGVPVHVHYVNRQVEESIKGFLVAQAALNAMGAGRQ